MNSILDKILDLSEMFLCTKDNSEYIKGLADGLNIAAAIFESYMDGKED